MTAWFGTTHTAATLAARGSLLQFGGVRLATLADGGGGGMRVLDFTTGSGLAFTVPRARPDMAKRGMATGVRSGPKV